jgi:hypothetical protein
MESGYPSLKNKIYKGQLERNFVADELPFPLCVLQMLVLDLS